MATGGERSQGVRRQPAAPARSARGCRSAAATGPRRPRSCRTQGCSRPSADPPTGFGGQRFGQPIGREQCWVDPAGDATQLLAHRLRLAAELRKERRDVRRLRLFLCDTESDLQGNEAVLRPSCNSRSSRLRSAAAAMTIRARGRHARSAAPHEPERGRQYAHAERWSAREPAACLCRLCAQCRHRRTPRTPRANRGRPSDTSSNLDEHWCRRAQQPPSPFPRPDGVG